MTASKHDKPASKPESNGGIFDDFNIGADFEAQIAGLKSPELPGKRTAETELVFQAPFSEEEIDRRVTAAKTQEIQRDRLTQTPPPGKKTAEKTLAKSEAGLDPEHAQYQFYMKRLQEKLESYPGNTPEESIKQSANIILYILQEFQYPIEEDKRDKIIRRMCRLLDLPVTEEGLRRPRTPFRGKRLQEKAETLYRYHMRRYMLHRAEQKRIAAAEEERKREEARAEDRARAELKRQERVRRLEQTSQALSEEKLKQLEDEFDAMIALSASNYGVDATQVLRFGYEEPEGGEPAAEVVEPTVELKQPAAPEGAAPAGQTGKPAGALTPQEIIERNNERRRQRGLLQDKK